jgi:transcriptional regulator with XRE-family HTH domain
MAKDAESTGSDIGRRIAQLRTDAGLTVADAAEQAGMAPDYLAYLESDYSAHPTQTTLTRLAAVLDVPVDTLAGADMKPRPSGQDGPGKPVLETLTTAQCLAHVAAGGVGRFLFVEPGRGPVAIPVNFVLDTNEVVFRTGQRTSIAEAMRDQQVSFDVDHLDAALTEGWSVLLSGTARIVTDPGELKHAAALGIQPWAGGERDVYVRMAFSRVTGRRIRIDR